MIAIAAAVLFLPAFLAEQTGHFSSLQAPPAIELIELVLPCSSSSLAYGCSDGTRKGAG